MAARWVLRTAGVAVGALGLAAAAGCSSANAPTNVSQTIVQAPPQPAPSVTTYVVPAPTYSPPPPTFAPPPAPIPAPGAAQAVTTVRTFIYYIGVGDYADAYNLFTRAGQARAGPESQWADGVAASSYTNQQFVGVTQFADGSGYTVELTFTSHQPPGSAQSCKDWDLDYQVLQQQDGSFLIDIVQPHSGGAGYVPC